MAGSGVDKIPVDWKAQMDEKDKKIEQLDKDKVLLKKVLSPLPFKIPHASQVLSLKSLGSEPVRPVKGHGPHTVEYHPFIKSQLASRN